jgi:D-xylose transport system permease protein
LIGLAVGAVYGFIFVRFSVPSFVITLAGLLALAGFQLQILGPNGSVNIPFTSWIVRFSQQMFLSDALSYAVAAVVALGLAASGLLRIQRRRAHGLSARSSVNVLVRAAALLVGVEVACWYLDRDRGISLPFVFFIGLVLLMHFLLTRTGWGRSVYAVGGNVEAARRAGINVTRVYMSVFVLCSGLAAVGGLISAGRLAAASTSSGGGDVNLMQSRRRSARPCSGVAATPTPPGLARGRLRRAGSGSDRRASSGPPRLTRRRAASG